MNKIILLAVTAIMTAMNVNAQSKEPPSADEEVIQLRGCRMGTPNRQFAPRRSPLFQNGETPYIGNRRQIVVMASFQDRDFKEGHDVTLTKWDKIFNAENYNEGKYVGSVHDYFSAQSYGQFNLQFDLMFVELPDKCVKYRSTYYDDENSQYMVNDIVDALQTQDIDWSLYDWARTLLMQIEGDLFTDESTPVVSFQSNPDLKGIDLFGKLLQAEITKNIRALNYIYRIDKENLHSQTLTLQTKKRFTYET